ncbi:MAG TPA: hypothetical protein DCP69_04460 [Candidatus Omnitrophica bacterium]|nr:hypothetical protein [Candidatus Omnitrophota bacterium]
MPICKDCNQGELGWRQNKRGGWYLVELVERPHFLNCTAQPKPETNTIQEEAVAFLRGMGFKAAESREWVRTAGGETVEGILKAVLQEIGRET